MNIAATILKPKPEAIRRYLFPGALAVIGVGLVWITYRWLPVGVDWHVFYDAARELMARRSPFIQGYYNPPWTLVPLLPLALLPDRLGSSLNAVAGLAIILYTAKKLGASSRVLFLLLVSPPVLFEFRLSNIAYMPVLALLAPTAAGMILALVKPQMMSGVILFWMVKSFRGKKLIAILLPVLILLAVSFALYGFWPALSAELKGVDWNVSVWPYGAPVGAALLYLAIRRDDLRFALAASPFLSPYQSLAGWIPVLLALVTEDRKFTMIWALAWAAFVMKWGIVGF